MVSDAFSQLADSLPAETPRELREVFRSLCSMAASVASPEAALASLRIAADLVSVPSALREVTLVDQWIAAPPTHARYCFLADHKVPI